MVAVESGDAAPAHRAAGGRRRSGRWRRALRAAITAGLMTVVGGAATFVGLWHIFPLPEDMLHPGPGGALVLDARGGVLVDTVAADEQRRLPISLAEVGPWIPAAVVAVEDASFRSHAGIDPSAILGAIKANEGQVYQYPLTIRFIT